MENTQIQIPEGWEKNNFGNLIIEKPKSQLKVSDATGFGNYPFFTSGEAILLHHKKQIEGENIFLATGGVANVKYHNGEVSYSTDTYALTTDNTDLKYLYYFLLNKLYYINSNYFLGSGLKHLQKKDLKNHSLVLPKSTTEQKKIAEILSKVDTAIEQTQSLIAKYQRIKTGLMQDLLTKGIDENGNIRSEETHEFKDSELGRIPVEWDYVATDTMCIENVVGIVIKPTQYYAETGVPMLRSFNVKAGKIEMRNLVFMKPEDNDRLIKSKLKLNDVVSVRTGYPGTSAIITEDIAGCNCIDLVISRVKEKILNPNFLVLWLNSELARIQILNHQSGIAQQHFNVGNMKELLIFKIEIEEQNEILKYMSSTSNVIVDYEKQLLKLTSIKTALMQDLLSGKKRVSNLIKENAL